MKNFTDKLVAAHSYTGENSNIVNLVDELSNKEENLVEYIIEKINKLILMKNSDEDALIRMDFENKFKLLAIIYNSSNDIVLYPKTMRDEYIKRWSKDLDIQEILMRDCLILGASKVDEIINMYNVKT